MRQTLLRFLLNDLWAFRVVPDDPEFRGWGPGLYVGAGWLLVPWAIVVLYWFLSYRPGQRRAGNEPPLPWFLLGLPILLFTLPMFIGDRAAGGFPVFGYGFMLFLAFLLGAWDASRRAKRVGISVETIWDLGMWMFFAGVIGSRLFHLIQYREQNFGQVKSVGEAFWQAINLSNGGMVLYGGVILGLITYVVFCRSRKLDPYLMADVMIPSGLLGVAIGRVGCLLNGCCYGDACSLPWAIQFPEGSLPWQAMLARGVIVRESGAELWLHPAQIYSTINGLLLYVLTAYYFRTRPPRGAVLGLGLIGYPLTRFLIEFLRADELGQFSTSLTISQWVSLGLMTVGIAVASRAHLRPTGTPPVNVSKPA